jgi:hypothetical protein
MLWCLDVLWNVGHSRRPNACGRAFCEREIRTIVSMCREVALDGSGATRPDEASLTGQTPGVPGAYSGLRKQSRHRRLGPSHASGSTIYEVKLWSPLETASDIVPCLALLGA